MLAVAPRAFLPFVICVRSDTMGSVGDLLQGVSTMARKAISLGSAPGMQTETRTLARVYAVTQQDADAAPDVVTGIISILDHDAYTLVDPGATHSFASKHFLDRSQIKTQPLEGRMRVSLPAGDPLFSDRVVRDSRVLIGGQEFPADLIALDMRDFDVVLGMD